MSVSNTRFASIDAMRGFAILLVVMGHVASHSLAWFDGLTFAIITTLHMPLFIILSGYFSTKALDLSPGGVFGFWKGKVLRLLLPLVLIPTLYQYIKYGALAPPLAAILNEFWFTYVLFMIIVAFYIFKALTQFCLSRGGKYQSLVELVFSVAGIVFVEYLAQFSEHYTWSQPLLLGRVAWLYKYFIIGYFWGKYPLIQEKLKSNVVGCLSALLFLLAVVLYAYFKLPLDYGASLQPIHILLALSACTLIYYTAYRLTDETQGISRVMITLGRYSLPIYLTHYFFLLPLAGLRPYIEGITNSSQLLGVEVLTYLFGAVLTLMPTFIVVRWVMANPLLAFVCYGEPLPKRKV